MGIYIPGMKMPKHRAMVLVFHPNGKCVDEFGNAYKTIELPPHGRLIDADALEFFYEESADGWRHTPVFMDFFKACAKGVREMPTIIPAEGVLTDETTDK